jgi:hypothetical protein
VAFKFTSLLEGAGNVAWVIDQAIRKSVEDAYKQGFHDGVERARQSVMTSLGELESADDNPLDASDLLDVPVAQSPVAKARAMGRPRSTTKTRVERGAIGEAVDQALQIDGGATLAQIVEEVRKRGVHASREGVGMHLRRNAGTRYRQAGRTWFLLGTGAEAETAGTVDQDATPAAS